MIESCRKNINTNDAKIEVDILLEDVRATEIKNATVVVMNFTLQFIPVEEREALLKKIYDGLMPGGVLILSEKTAFANPAEEQFMIALHHHMKVLNGYDQLEIASKRQALEDILVPETISIHQERLEKVGFETAYVWLNCFNFVSLIAIKSD